MDAIVKNTLAMNHDITPEHGAASHEAPARARGPVPSVCTVAACLILASVWIVGSDLMLIRFAADETRSGFIQWLRALNFLATSGVLLFFVLRHAYNGWQIAEKHRAVASDHAREQSRRLSSHVQALREEDRTWVAREIHDELGQLLTGIKMQLRLIENRLSDRDDRTLNPVIDKLVETSDLVDSTIASVQRISAGLRPSSLDHLGLAAALTEEAEQFSQRTGIPCAVEIGKVPDHLSPEVITTVFRIFQESLTNAARHAKASLIAAGLSMDENVLKLTIHDNGEGIDPAAIEDPKSLGLIGMQERAENVGGLVTFTRHPRKGTNVTLTVPLPCSGSDPDLPP